MKEIYKLASKLRGLYLKLYKDTSPFHNENTDSYQETAFEILAKIEDEVNKQFEKK
jgi:hypothetical protein